MCAKKSKGKGKGKGKGKKGKGSAKSPSGAPQPPPDPNAGNPGTCTGSVCPPTYAAGPAIRNISYIGPPCAPNAVICPPLPETCLGELCPPKFAAVPANSDVAHIGRIRDTCPTVIVVTPGISQLRDAKPTSLALRRRSYLTSGPDCPCIEGQPSNGESRWDSLPTVIYKDPAKSFEEWASCRPNKPSDARCSQSPPCFALPCVGQCVGSKRPIKEPTLHRDFEVVTEDFGCQVTMTEPSKVVICGTGDDPTCPNTNKPCGQSSPKEPEPEHYCDPEPEPEQYSDPEPQPVFEHTSENRTVPISVPKMPLLVPVSYKREEIPEPPVNIRLPDVTEYDDSPERVICGASVTTCGDSLSPCGDSLSPCGDSLSPCGDSLSPCGDLLPPCADTNTVCGDSPTCVDPICDLSPSVCDPSPPVCNPSPPMCNPAPAVCDSCESESGMLCQNTDPGGLCNSDFVNSCGGMEGWPSFEVTGRWNPDVETESYYSESSGTKCCPTDPTTDNDTSSSGRTRCCDSTAIRALDTLIQRCGKPTCYSETREICSDGEFRENISREQQLFEDFEKSKTSIPHSMKSIASGGHQSGRQPCDPPFLGRATPTSLVSTALAVVDPQNAHLARSTSAAECEECPRPCTPPAAAPHKPTFSSGDVCFAAKNQGVCGKTSEVPCAVPVSLQSVRGKKGGYKSATPSHASTLTNSVTTAGDGVSLRSQPSCKPVYSKHQGSFQKSCGPMSPPGDANRLMRGTETLEEGLCNDYYTSDRLTKPICDSRQIPENDPTYEDTVCAAEPTCDPSYSNIGSQRQSQLTCCSEQLQEVEPSYSRLICRNIPHNIASKCLPRTESTDSDSSLVNRPMKRDSEVPTHGILQKKYVCASEESSVSGSISYTSQKRIPCHSGRTPDTDSVRSDFLRKKFVCGSGYAPDTDSGKSDVSHRKITCESKQSHEMRQVCRSELSRADTQKRIICGSESIHYKDLSLKKDICGTKAEHRRIVCGIRQSDDGESPHRRIVCGHVDGGDSLGTVGRVNRGAGGIRMRIVCAGDSSARQEHDRGPGEVQETSRSKRLICGGNKRIYRGESQTGLNTMGSHAETAVLPQRNRQLTRVVCGDQTRNVGGDSNAKRVLCVQSGFSESASYVESESSVPISASAAESPHVKKIVCGGRRVQGAICESSESYSAITGTSTAREFPSGQESFSQRNKIKRIVCGGEDVAHVRPTDRERYGHVMGGYVTESPSSYKEETPESVEETNVCRGRQFDGSKSFCRTKPSKMVNDLPIEKYNKKSIRRGPQEKRVICRGASLVEDICENRGKEAVGNKGRDVRSQGVGTPKYGIGGKRDSDSDSDVPCKKPELRPGKFNIRDTTNKRIPEIPSYDGIHAEQNVSNAVHKNKKVSRGVGVCEVYTKKSASTGYMSPYSGEYGLRKERSRICPKDKSKNDGIKSKESKCSCILNSKDTESRNCLYQKKMKTSNENISRKTSSKESIRGRHNAKDLCRCEARGMKKSEHRSHQTTASGASLPNVRVLDLNDPQFDSLTPVCPGKAAQNMVKGPQFPCNVGNQVPPKRKPGQGGTVIILDKPKTSYPCFKKYMAPGRPTVPRTVNLGKLLDEIAPGTIDELAVALPPDLTVPDYSAMEITLISITATEPGSAACNNVKSSVPKSGTVEASTITYQQPQNNQQPTNVNQQTMSGCPQQLQGNCPNLTTSAPPTYENNPKSHINWDKPTVCKSAQLEAKLYGSRLRDTYMTGNYYSTSKSSHSQPMSQNNHAPDFQISQNAQSLNTTNGISEPNQNNSQSNTSPNGDADNRPHHEYAQAISAAPMDSNHQHRQEQERGDGTTNNKLLKRSETNNSLTLQGVQQNQNVDFASTHTSNIEKSNASTTNGRGMECNRDRSCWQLNSFEEEEEETVGPCPCGKLKPKEKPKEDPFDKKLDYKRVIDKHYHSLKGVIYTGHFEPLYENIHEELRAIERDKENRNKLSEMLKQEVNEETKNISEQKIPLSATEVLSSTTQVPLSLNTPPNSSHNPNESERQKEKCSERCPAKTASECQTSHPKDGSSSNMCIPQTRNGKRVSRSVSRISYRSSTNQSSTKVGRQRTCKPAGPKSSHHKSIQACSCTSSHHGINNSSDCRGSRSKNNLKYEHRSVNELSLYNGSDRTDPGKVSDSSLLKDKSYSSINTSSYPFYKPTQDGLPSSNQLHCKPSRERLHSSTSKHLLCIQTLHQERKQPKYFDRSAPQQLRFAQSPSSQPPPPAPPPTPAPGPPPPEPSGDSLPPPLTRPNKEYSRNTQSRCEKRPGEMQGGCASRARTRREEGDPCGPFVGICSSPSGPPANQPPSAPYPVQDNDSLFSRNAWQQQECAANETSFEKLSLHRRWEKMETLIDDPVEVQCNKWRQCTYLARNRYGPAPPGCLREAPASCPQSEQTRAEQYMEEKLMTALWEAVDSNGVINVTRPSAVQDDDTSAYGNNDNGGDYDNGGAYDNNGSNYNNGIDDNNGSNYNNVKGG